MEKSGFIQMNDCMWCVGASVSLQRFRYVYKQIAFKPGELYSKVSVKSKPGKTKGPEVQSNNSEHAVN